MSGLPPPGSRHVLTTLRCLNEINEIEPSPRLDT